MDIYLLASLFFVAYFLQSVFGFGATILSLVLVSFFMWTWIFKEIVFLTVYTWILAPIVVYATDRKSLDIKHLKYILIHAIPGLILWWVLLAFVSTEILIFLFSLFLFYYSWKTLLDTWYVFPKILQKPLVIASWFMQWFIGVWGPFAVMWMKDAFLDKRHMRVTLAVYFFLTNMLRAVQLYIQWSFDISQTYAYWPIFVVVPLWSILGYLLHVKISNNRFNKGISLILLLSAIKMVWPLVITYIF
jgi:uncharacterized membrane protein YfcA